MNQGRYAEAEEMLVVAEGLKEKGNKCFSAGDFTSAIKHYTKIPLYVDWLPVDAKSIVGDAECPDSGVSDSQKLRALQLRHAAYLNCARACGHRAQVARGIDFASRALVAATLLQSIALTTSDTSTSVSPGSVKLSEKEKKAGERETASCRMVRAMLRIRIPDIDGATEDCDAAAAAGLGSTADVQRCRALIRSCLENHRQRERQLFGGWLSRPAAH